MVKHGDVVTCAGCFKCKKCGTWKMMIAELPFSLPSGKFSCPCGANNWGAGKPYYSGDCKHFAPIEPRSVSIPESLKEQAEELVNVKETIAEPEKEMV